MGDSRVCMFIAKRNSGKSVLVKDILWHLRHLPVGMVCSGTEDGNGYYSKFVPASFVYSGFDKEAVERLIKRQRKLSRQGTVQPAFLVLDDCTYDKKTMREKCIRNLFLNGRHLSLALLVTSQYVADVGPEIRANCDYVFVLRENILANRERLHKMFFGVFPTLAAFNAAMDACTEDYGCLVLDNTSQSNKIEDCVFWYKAKIRNNFRMGSPLLWHWHSRHYNPNHDDEDDDPPSRGADRRGQLVSVQKLPARPVRRR